MSIALSAPSEAAPGIVLAAAATKASSQLTHKIGKRVNGALCWSTTRGHPHKSFTNDELAGKNWHAPKNPFRPTAGQTSYAKRKEKEKAAQVTKARELEMKEEKEAERNRRIQAIKDRRKAKEEKERYEKMAEKMHKKLVERRKKREKRNKLLKS
jgi:rRNA-processing protein CGR1